MKRGWAWLLLLGTIVSRSGALAAGPIESVPNTAPLTTEGDLSARMVEGIDRFLTRATGEAGTARGQFWHRDFSSPAAYEKSVQTNRDHLRSIIGAVDPRVAHRTFEVLTQPGGAILVGETESFTVKAVRWPVFEEVSGEGLWLQPKQPPRACVVALPDADQTPELIVGLIPGLAPERQFARRLAENGCEVLVPAVVDRLDTWSGNERLGRFTNQPHREWIYRPAFEMGRHIIGYEVQNVLAAIDCLSESHDTGKSNTLALGVAGYGEGGLAGFYAAALDTRLRAALISGYFDSREQLWSEPIYRNIFGLLREFGDAEVASLIWPRSLVVEHSPAPKIDGPPPPRRGRSGAAPGKISTADYQSIESELERARGLVEKGRMRTNSPAEPKTALTVTPGAEAADPLLLICGTEGMPTGPVSDRALTAFLKGLGIACEQPIPPGKDPSLLQTNNVIAERQHRLVKAYENHTQALLRRSHETRTQFFWNNLKASSPQDWERAVADWREKFHNETIGRVTVSNSPLNARARKIQDRAKWTGFEVVLDVCPDVFAWGYLLVPNGLKAGERRPVVVCQHGLEGLPTDVLDEDPSHEGFHYYKAFAARLAERGFVVFAPHNPYRGGDRFRQLQRKANPLGLSLFSFIIAQHSRILDWLATLPFVEPGHIGFYGLSYGGKTAMRVPAALPGYCLSICSGDFNEWVFKCVSTDFPSSYVFSGEYEMPEWNLGHTFNYAEMAALIAPRPFMVERGHADGVGADEWVAFEYAKVRRLYDALGTPERTRIEFFNGPHTIHGIGTFDFLEQHLR